MSKNITILYTKDKAENLDDAFAIFHFVVYNQKDFERVIKNIEEHYDGVVIECSEGTRKEYEPEKRKRR